MEYKTVPQEEVPNNESVNETVETPIEIPQVKRGRGRPKGSGNKAKETTNTETETINTGSFSKPGRKPKAKSTPNLARQIEGIHKMVAMLPGLEVMAMSADESAILAEAMTGVGDEYGVTISGKTAATLQLVGALAMCYGPRILYMREMAKKRKAEMVPPNPPETNQPELDLGNGLS